jgi:hypothetical protein
MTNLIQIINTEIKIANRVLENNKKPIHNHLQRKYNILMSIFIINLVVKDFKINHKIKSIIIKKLMIMRKVQMIRTIQDKEIMVQIKIID